MDAISNEEIRNAYHYVLTLQIIAERDFQLVKGNKSHINKLVPSNLVNVYSQKRQDAISYVDKVNQTLYDVSVVSLVTAFERAIFKKYSNSYGKLRNVVKDNAKPPLEFYLSRERFINDGIDKLAGILSLIDGLIDADTMMTLKQIKDQRNYIVHGKRDFEYKAPPVDLSLDIIAKTLDNVITEIS